MTRRTALALAGSFAVHLLPVVGPHAGFLVGVLVVLDVGRLFQGGDPGWVAADLALVALLQAGAFALLRFVLAGRRRRWLLVPVAGVAATWTVNVAFLVVIPAWFLIEPEASAENRSWPTACVLDGAHLMPVASGAGGALARAGEAWVERGPDRGWALLAADGCAAKDLGVGGGDGFGVEYAVPGGRAVLRRHAAGDQPSHWILPGPGAMPVALARPDLSWWGPALSRDGSAIAWIESAPRTPGGRPVRELVRRRLADGHETRVALPGQVRSSPRIVEVGAGAAPPVTIAHADGVLELDAGGQVTAAPLAFTDPDLPDHGILLSAGGWVAWDQYREEGRHRVAWSLPGGTGRHEVPKGRGISHLALDPAARHVALSVTTNLSIGDVRDAVYVLRVRDGAEVYRRFLPRYSRAAVAFLGDEWFAYTVYETRDGVVRGRVEVLAVPGGGG